MKTNRILLSPPRRIFRHVALIALALSCNPDTPLDKEAPPATEPQSESVSVMQLGKQLENPYSLANMQRALDTLNGQLTLSDTDRARALVKTAASIKIETTDLYVRFLPKDTAEMKRLAKDAALELYDYPLDYEIKASGNYYRDPALPADRPARQYTVVKPDYAFPDVEHEILAELFIPQNSEGYHIENARIARGGYARNTLNMLETVSLHLTDNLPAAEKEQIEQQRKRNQAARTQGRVCVWFVCWNEPDKWTPDGHVKVENTSKKDKLTNKNELNPVKRVKVRARRWFTIKTAYTDANGYFKVGHEFKRPANYSLVFVNEYVSIKPSWFVGLFGSARYEGPKKTGSWDITFYYNSVGWLWSGIINAFYDYRFIHAPKYGILKPPFVRVVANQGGGNKKSYCNMLGHAIETGNVGAFLNDMRIYKYGNNSEKVYSRMMHELGHASHWALVGHSMYVDNLGWDAYLRPHTDWNRRTLLESWAESTEMVFTREVYPEYYAPQNPNTKVYESTLQDETAAYWRSKGGYISAIHEDLLDAVNQRAVYGNSKDKDPLPQDRVSGYSLTDVYYALRGVRDMQGWRYKLYHNYPGNPTRRYLTEYFQNYGYY